MADPTPTDVRNQLDAMIAYLEGGAATLSPSAVQATIDRWLNTLAAHDGFNDVATTLGELRSALEPPIDRGEVTALVERLGERTRAAATRIDDEAVTERLERLGELLARAAGALGGGSGTRPTATDEDPNVAQQRASTHGPMPQGSQERPVRTGDVGTGGSSETPGTSFDPH